MSLLQISPSPYHLKKTDLVVSILDFVSQPSQPLVPWSQILGSCSWALNTFPLSHFSLQSGWAKPPAKQSPTLPFLSPLKSKQNFNCFPQLLTLGLVISSSKTSTGTSPEQISVFFANTCPSGIGIWLPSLNRAWSQPLLSLPCHIYWAKALAVVQAILIAIDACCSRVVIFSQSLLCFQVFSCHKPSIVVWPLFCFIIPLLLSKNIDIKVIHVPGLPNSTADSLSHSNLCFMKFQFPQAISSQIVFDPSIINGGIPWLSNYLSSSNTLSISFCLTQPLSSLLLQFPNTIAPSHISLNSVLIFPLI